MRQWQDKMARVLELTGRRKSAKYCITCNVVLCKHCYKQFHTSNVPLSPCSDHHPLLRNRSTRSSAVTPSPSAKQLQILSRCSRRPVESSPPPTNRQASNAPSTPTRIGKNYKKQGHSVPPNAANVLHSPGEGQKNDRRIPIQHSVSLALRAPIVRKRDATSMLHGHCLLDKQEQCHLILTNEGYRLMLMFQ